MCVCVCVCEREREREIGEKERERERERVYEKKNLQIFFLSANFASCETTNVYMYTRL